jgi:CO/xanthine dehydrogenase Mo-binding subunit
MDELAVALNIDPVELRLRNEPEQDEFKKLPFEPLDAGMLPCRRGALRLEPPQPRTAFHARWPLDDRLGHGKRYLPDELRTRFSKGSPPT